MVLVWIALAWLAAGGLIVFGWCLRGETHVYAVARALPEPVTASWDWPDSPTSHYVTGSELGYARSHAEARKLYALGAVGWDGAHPGLPLAES